MISIIIPTFNEVNNIKVLLFDLINILKNQDYEIVVVDDDSPDGTGEEVYNSYKMDEESINEYNEIEDKDSKELEIDGSSILNILIKRCKSKKVN